MVPLKWISSRSTTRDTRRKGTQTYRLLPESAVQKERFVDKFLQFLPMSRKGGAPEVVGLMPVGEEDLLRWFYCIRGKDPFHRTVILLWALWFSSISTLPGRGTSLRKGANQKIQYHTKFFFFFLISYKVNRDGKKKRIVLGQVLWTLKHL